MQTNLYAWSTSQFQTFLLMMTRVSFILFMMPLLNSRNIPASFKVGLTLATSLILLPVVKMDASSFPLTPFHFAFFLISEAMIGFLLGLSMKLIFAGIQLAGEFTGFQMGFGMASLMSPQSGLETTLVAELHYLLALLLFLSINGHHWFFKALAQSFHLLPPGELNFQEGGFQYLLSLSGTIFSLAIKIAAPVMAILILTQIALGIVAKMVPQVNILMSSFPLTIGLGLIFLGLSMELLLPYLKTLFDESGKGLGMTLLPLMKR